MKVTTLLRQYWIFFFSLSFLVACIKEDPNVPATQRYVSASKDFRVNKFDLSLPDASAIDFSKDSLGFEADFNEEVTWTITIKSKLAIKVISGTSKSLDPKQIYWDGASDNVYFFNPDEPLSIQISFLGSDVVLNENKYKVGKSKVFHKNKITTVVADFELATNDNESVIFQKDAINIFFDPFEGISTKNDGFILDSVSTFPRVPQGKRYIYLHGKDILGAAGSFYIGGFNNSSKSFLLKSKPLDQVYINFLANSNGNKTTKLIIELTGVGGDEFRAEKNVTWDGWRMVSIKLSDFTQSTSGALGTAKILPAALKQVAFQIHSGGGPGREAKAFIDYICFTYDAPFSQAQ